MTFDISIVLALHREGRYLRRTLLSLIEAVSFATSVGISVELVATFDCADDDTVAAFDHADLSNFDAVRKIYVSNGSLGPTRNDGIEAARGRFISLADGDDLVSFNMLAACFNLAQTHSSPKLIFPEYIYAFGARYHCVRYFPLRYITPILFVAEHPYYSRAFGHRSIFEQVKFVDACAATGYAYEDWHFNAECVASGIDIDVATDTIPFYRQRSGSLLQQSQSHTTRQIPPTKLLRPEVFLSLARDTYMDSYSMGRRAETLMIAAPDILNTPLHRNLIGAANHIDPSVDIIRLKEAEFSSNSQWCRPEVGLAYYEMCDRIGNLTFNDVFIVPFIAAGGADFYIQCVMDELYAWMPVDPVLIIIGENTEAEQFSDRVPPNAVVIDMSSE